jgi:hypothetical protein
VKAAAAHHLPVFVITHPTPGSSRRDVTLGWVAGDDDRSRQFLVLFGEQAPAPVADVDATPFELTERTGTVRTAQVRARPGQQRFAFAVFRRYGPACMVCGIGLTAVLEAAHLRPKARAGSDDPRNGMVLCATHHRAYDAGLFAVEPGTRTLHPDPSGPSLGELRIIHTALVSESGELPHEAALSWRWHQARRAEEAEAAGLRP